MIKSAIEYMYSLGKRQVGQVQEIDGLKYWVTSDDINLINRPTNKDAIKIKTLTSLVKYLNSEVDVYSTDRLVVHVEDYNRVIVKSQLLNGLRDTYVSCDARTPDIQFEKQLNPEKFIVMLQSCFEKTDDLMKILEVVGNIKEENITNYSDDGVTQQVVAKKGISRLENVAVPNPVLLVPFRTFNEVEQPASKFVFRMQDGPTAALFEADGGAWKNEAMQNIKKYLEEYIQVGNVEIIA